MTKGLRQELRFASEVVDRVCPPPEGLPCFPQRATRGGQFRKQLGFIPQLFSLKYNGWMCVVHWPSMACFNRHGQRLSIEADFEAAILDMRLTVDMYVEAEQIVDGTEEWFVCEALQRRHSVGQGSLFLIDYIPSQMGILPRNPKMYERHAYLNGMFANVHDWRERPMDDHVYLIDQFEATDEILLSMWDEIPTINEEWGCEFYEGFVATAKDSLYKPGYSPNQQQSNIIKYRHDS